MLRESARAGRGCSIRTRNTVTALIALGAVITRIGTRAGVGAIDGYDEDWTASDNRGEDTNEAVPDYADIAVTLFRWQSGDALAGPDARVCEAVGRTGYGAGLRGSRTQARWALDW
ncbi:MAG: hypothetical protein H5T86_08705 [Armatimonadetes bacterium]|nr:hypothetical protein [Armatimonadota bacterium]